MRIRALLLVACLLPACAATDTAPETTASFVGCLPTIPDGSFIPPDPYPAIPAGEELAWYGTPGLWTALPRDGLYPTRKSVWWSTNYGGGATEPRPEIEVVWTRLDEPTAPIANEPPVTNAFTDEEGWFMIAGLDPDEPGCWRVTATYKGATLSYVYSRVP